MGITSSMPEDELAVVMLQSALGRFLYFLASFFLFKTKVYILVDSIFVCACSRALWV
jgi:hypothetical protein